MRMVGMLGSWAAVACAVTGCDEFATPAELATAQVLAIRTEPPAVPPGGRAELEILVADSDGPIAAPDITWETTAAVLGEPPLGAVVTLADGRAEYTAPTSVDETPTVGAVLATVHVDPADPARDHDGLSPWVRPLSRVAAAGRLETSKRQREVEPSARLAVEPMPEQIPSPLESIGHGPICEMQTARRLASVLTGIEEDLERLDQLVAHPRVGEERAELALDDHRGQLGVAQKQTLDAELSEVVDDAATADVLRDSEAFVQLSQPTGDRRDTIRANGDGGP